MIAAYEFVTLTNVYVYKNIRRQTSITSKDIFRERFTIFVNNKDTNLLRSAIADKYYQSYKYPGKDKSVLINLSLSLE